MPIDSEVVATGGTKISYPCLGQADLWVDPVRGNDATGVRGDAHYPFRTVQAALTWSQDGDTVHLTSGTYVEDVTMPDRQDLIIEGEGPENTVIAGTGAAKATFSWTPLIDGIKRFAMRNLRIFNTTKGSDLVRIDGSKALKIGMFFEGATFENVWFIKPNDGFSAFFKCCGYITLDRVKCYVPSGTSIFRAEECTSVIAQQSEFNSVEFRFEASLTAPPTGRYAYQLNDNTLIHGDLRLLGHPYFIVDRTSSIYGNTTATSLTQILPTYYPAIWIQGLLGDPRVSPGPAATFLLTTGTILVLDYSICYARLNIGYSSPTPRKDVLARHAFFAYQISLGGEVDLDLRLSKYREGNITLVAGTPTVNQTTVSATVPEAIPGGPTQVTFAVPFPSNSYRILLTAFPPPGAPVGVGTGIVPGTKLSTGFQFGSTTIVGGYVFEVAAFGDPS